jgi:hypothetical protein
MSWIKVEDELPPLDKLVWLCEDERIFIGARVLPPDSDGWLWAEAYGTVICRIDRWDCPDLEEDDLHPTHWMALPELPKEDV